MTSSDPDGWQADAEVLANLARNESRGEEERRRALRDLQPIVRRVARRVARRYGGADGADMEDEALGVVWEALQGYETGRPFELWCYGVLKNHLIDQQRKEQHE